MKARYLLSTQQFKDLCIWLFWLSAYAAFCVLLTHLLKQLGAFAGFHVRGCLLNAGGLHCLSWHRYSDRYGEMAVMNAKVPAPSARAGLRLLCRLCQKTGAYQPVATLRPMPPLRCFLVVGQMRLVNGHWLHVSSTYRWDLFELDSYLACRFVAIRHSIFDTGEAARMIGKIWQRDF